MVFGRVCVRWLCQESTGTFWLTVHQSSEAEAGYTCRRAVKGAIVPMDIPFGRV